MSWKDALTRPPRREHLVQFYGDERALIQNVSRYLQEGVDRGEWMIVVATPDHVRAFSERLRQAGIPVDDLTREGKLTVLDAEKTLSRFLAEGQPDWTLFNEVVGSFLRDTLARAAGAGVRAYGEMVNLLWKDGKLGAATRLEGFWNRLLEQNRFSLFCAYTVDLLGSDTPSAALQEMISTHSHLLPERSNGELEAAVGRALEEVLGKRTAGTLLPLIRADVVNGIVLPFAERTVLWLRKNLPPYAGEVLRRARAYYEEACARKVGVQEG